MKNSKLIRMLMTFSKEEFRDFELYINSPYFNSSRITIKFFNELKKFYPAFDNNLITREYFHGKLYKGKRFNKQVMWNLASHFEKMANEFLELRAFRNQYYRRKELLLGEMGKRKLLRNYLSILNEMEIKLDTGGIDYDYFENKGHLEDLKQNYYHLIDRVEKMADSKVRASEYQIMLVLRMTVGGLNDMQVLTRDHNSKFDVNIPMEFAENLNLRNIYEYACAKNFEFAFLIGIYYHALMLFVEPDEDDHLDKLRDLFEQHYKKFTQSEKRNIMHWILNYCSYRSLEEETKYRRIIFDLNKFRVSEGLAYYPEEQIPRAIYTQILNSALFVREFKWAEDFLVKYTPKLQSQMREPVSAIAYANLHFKKEEYEKVLDDLKKAKFEKLRDKIDARIIKSEAYYELSEIETLLYYIDSSLRFLTGHSIPKSTKIPNSRFLTALKKIVSIKEKSDLKSIPQLKNTILQEEDITDRNWLMKKLEELN